MIEKPDHLLLRFSDPKPIGIFSFNGITHEDTFSALEIANKVLVADANTQQQFIRTHLTAEEEMMLTHISPDRLYVTTKDQYIIFTPAAPEVTERVKLPPMPSNLTDYRRAHGLLKEQQEAKSTNDDEPIFIPNDHDESAAIE